MVGMLVGDQNLADLLRLISEFFERVNIVIAFDSHKNRRRGIRYGLWDLFRHAGVDQDHLVPRVDHIVLQARPIAHSRVKGLRAVLSAEGEGLQHISLVIQFYSADFHCGISSHLRAIYLYAIY